jgi:hypothetical protein
MILTAALLGCQTRNSRRTSTEDSYAPKLRIAVTNLLSDKPETAYRFTKDQLASMSRTKLDTNRVVHYLEHRWPIERLRAYCAETNSWHDWYQNLVAHNCVVETEVHRGKKADFDRIWIYVDQDDGRDNTYFGEAGTRWHRWAYSLNTVRDTNHWVVIEQLPNDFMDSAKYNLSGPDGPENGSQPIRPETNSTSSAAGSRR